MSTMPLPITRSLAHPGSDPPSLVARAMTALGWRGSDFLVGLQGYDELMETLEVAADVEGLARVGNPTSPPLRLLRALYSSDVGLSVTRVATVASPWRWTRVGEGTAEIVGVALRQQTYADVVGALGRAGVTFRVLPDDTSTAALLDVGRLLGSAVVDVDEVPDDGLLVPGYLDDLPPIAYGLVSRAAAEASDVVWLSMTPERESAGTLMAALQRFADLGLNLDFLHSDPVAPDLHHFHVGFRAGAERLADLQDSLRGGGFTSRVLAAFEVDRS